MELKRAQGAATALPAVIQTEDAVQALVDHLVVPALPLGPCPADSLNARQEESVSKQMHAVVLIYNYFHRKQFPQLEFLTYESVCKLAAIARPSLLWYMKIMRKSKEDSGGLNIQPSLTEKMVMDACNISKSLDASRNAPDMETWPVSKIAVFLIDPTKEKCLLQFSSITQGVWSLVEKDVELVFNNLVGGTQIQNERTTIGSSGDKSIGIDSILNQLALSAAKENTGIDQSNLSVVEHHIAYSLSREKTTTVLYIMTYTGAANEEFTEVPVKEVLSSLNSPIFKSGLPAEVTPAVEYYHLLPFVDIICSCLSREKAHDGSLHVVRPHAVIDETCSLEPGRKPPVEGLDIHKKSDCNEQSTKTLCRKMIKTEHATISEIVSEPSVTGVACRSSSINGDSAMEFDGLPPRGVQAIIDKTSCRSSSITSGSSMGVPTNNKSTIEKTVENNTEDSETSLTGSACRPSAMELDGLPTRGVLAIIDKTLCRSPSSTSGSSMGVLSNNESTIQKTAENNTTGSTGAVVLDGLPPRGFQAIIDNTPSRPPSIANCSSMGVLSTKKSTIKKKDEHNTTRSTGAVAQDGLPPRGVQVIIDKTPCRPPSITSDSSMGVLNNNKNTIQKTVKNNTEDSETFLTGAACRPSNINGDLAMELGVLPTRSVQAIIDKIPCRPPSVTSGFSMGVLSNNKSTIEKTTENNIEDSEKSLTRAACRPAGIKCDSAMELDGLPPKCVQAIIDTTSFRPPSILSGSSMGVLSNNKSTIQKPTENNTCGSTELDGLPPRGVQAIIDKTPCKQPSTSTGSSMGVPSNIKSTIGKTVENNTSGSTGAAYGKTSYSSLNLEQQLLPHVGDTRSRGNNISEAHICTRDLITNQVEAVTVDSVEKLNTKEFTEAEPLGSAIIPCATAQDTMAAHDLPFVIMPSTFRDHDRFQLVPPPKKNDLLHASVRILQKKLDDLSQQQCLLQEEVARYEMNIQAILTAEEENLTSNIELMIEACDNLCSTQMQACKCLYFEERISPPLKRRRLSEAVLMLQSPCEELHSICRANNWFLPRYSVLPSVSYAERFQANVMVQGIDFQFTVDGELKKNAREARQSAASCGLSKLRTMAEQAPRQQAGFSVASMSSC